jgi:pyruvate dehydrogenase complex dehydrogenase (E1) component
MEDMFKLVGIYSSKGQLYEPVDRKVIQYYKEARDGQLLEEGINEAGAMGSFIAAGSAHANLGKNGQQHRPQLFGSGPILRSALKAQDLLADQFGIGTDVWSVTSYSELRRNAMECRHWNDLHPGEAPRVSYLESVLDGVSGPFISTSDNVRLVADQIREWVPGQYIVLLCRGCTAWVPTGWKDFRPRLINLVWIRMRFSRSMRNPKQTVFEKPSLTPRVELKDDN